MKKVIHQQNNCNVLCGKTASQTVAGAVYLHFGDYHRPMIPHCYIFYKLNEPFVDWFLFFFVCVHCICSLFFRLNERALFHNFCLMKKKGSLTFAACLSLYFVSFYHFFHLGISIKWSTSAAAQLALPFVIENKSFVANLHTVWVWCVSQ